MLLSLKDYWISKWYFIEKKLNEFSEAKRDWFDNIKKVVIDFDETWKKFGDLSSKTADVLDIKNDNNLNFIEFKNIIDNWNIEEFIKNLNFDLKVEESFHLLRRIIKERNFWTIENRKNFNETRNQFIFSIAWDISYELETLLSLEVLGLEDYDKTLEKVFWIETKNLKNYL